MSLRQARDALDLEGDWRAAAASVVSLAGAKLRVDAEQVDVAGHIFEQFDASDIDTGTYANEAAFVSAFPNLAVRNALDGRYFRYRPQGGIFDLAAAGVVADGATDYSARVQQVLGYMQAIGVKTLQIVPGAIFGNLTAFTGLKITGPKSSDYALSAVARTAADRVILPADATHFLDLAGEQQVELSHFDLDGNGAWTRGVSAIIDSVGGAYGPRLIYMKAYDFNWLVLGNSSNLAASVFAHATAVRESGGFAKNFRDSRFLECTASGMKGAVNAFYNNRCVFEPNGGQNDVRGGFYEHCQRTENGALNAVHLVCLIAGTGEFTFDGAAIDRIYGQVFRVLEFAGKSPTDIKFTNNTVKGVACGADVPNDQRVAVYTDGNTEIDTFTHGGNQFQRRGSAPSGNEAVYSPIGAYNVKARKVVDFGDNTAQLARAEGLTIGAPGHIPERAWVATTGSEYVLTEVYQRVAEGASGPSSGWPMLVEPLTVFDGDTRLTKGTAGALNAGEWAFAAHAASGRKSSIHVRRSDNSNLSSVAVSTAANIRAIYSQQVSKFTGEDRSLPGNRNRANAVAISDGANASFTLYTHERLQENTMMNGLLRMTGRIGPNMVHFDLPFAVHRGSSIDYAFKPGVVIPGSVYTGAWTAGQNFQFTGVVRDGGARISLNVANASGAALNNCKVDLVWVRL